MGTLIAASQPDEFPSEGAGRLARAFSENFVDILLYLVLAVLIVIAGGTAIWWVRRRLKSQTLAGPIAEGASLNTFREMRDRGELSEQEYQAIRENLVRRMRDEMDA